MGLCRFGRLRSPSEVLSLRWQDVLWDTDRIVVQSPKTEHHPGKGSRTMRLFPELRPILEEAFHLAEEGAVYVVGGAIGNPPTARAGGEAATSERNLSGL